jgi:hypothetical protein
LNALPWRVATVTVTSWIANGDKLNSCDWDNCFDGALQHDIVWWVSALFVRSTGVQVCWMEYLGVCEGTAHPLQPSTERNILIATSYDFIKELMT